MILQALHQLAVADNLLGDPDFELKPIRYVITVKAGGKLGSIADTNSEPPAEAPAKGKKPKKGKPTPQTYLVPRDAGFNTRTAGVYAGLLFDKASYVFGVIVDEDDRTEKALTRTAAQKAAFRQRALDVYHATQDEGVKAVVDFLDAVAAGSGPELPADCGPGDLFGFIYDKDPEHLVTSRPKVRAWWKAQRTVKPTDGAQMQCLVTGTAFGEPDLFPKIKRVPGVAGDTSLVSFNAGAFNSYGLDGNENAPICRDAAESVATALNRLLHPAYPNPDPLKKGEVMKPRSFRLSADTGLCFWSTSGDTSLEDAFPSLLEAVPENVPKLYHSIWSGKPPAGETDMSPFYGLVITGTTGRAILRGWFETTLGNAKRNIAAHFEDTRIVRNAPWRQGEEPPPGIPLRTLLESVSAQGDQENIPAAVASDVARAALTGVLYPMNLLVRAVERARAEAGRSEWKDLQRRDARAALIKAVLNRHHRLNPSPDFKEVLPTMDAGNTHPGYILGALMAVLERLQQEALGDVNASVVDKHFSGASASPRATFDRLVRNARHHARKAADGDNPGFIYNLERLLDSLLSRINVNDRDDIRAGRPIGFPLTLPIEEQGLFVIGYHHMRHWLFMSKEERASWEAANPSAPAAFLWQTRNKNRPATTAPNAS